MKKTVIANLSPEYFDQAYNYFTFEKIRMHDRSKYRFILIYLQQKSDRPNRMEADGFPCHYLFQKNQKVRLIPAVRKLIRILKTEQADLIHAHNRACIVCAIWAALFLPKLKVLAHVHNFNLTRNLKRRLFYRLLGWKIACIVGCSESNTAFLKRNVPGVSPEKFTAIPNSINVERFSTPTVERNTMRADFGCMPSHFVFLGIGRLAEEKGFHRLIHAFKPIYEKHPQARLVIAGEGEERKRLTELIRTLALQSAVFLLGFRKDAVNLLHAADCFVLASRKECLPLVVLEAIAARCPVISTDCGGVKDILSSPDYGVMIPLADEPALTHSMLTVIEVPNEQLKKQTEAAVAVFSRFSHHSAIIITERLYSRILN